MGQRVQMACMHRCLPLEVALGTIRLKAAEGASDWQAEVAGLFEGSEQLAKAIRARL